MKQSIYPFMLSGVMKSMNTSAMNLRSGGNRLSLLTICILSQELFRRYYIIKICRLATDSNYYRKSDAKAIIVDSQQQLIETRKQEFTAIPYYAWAHRGVGEMTIWFPEKLLDIEVISK